MAETLTEKLLDELLFTDDIDEYLDKDEVKTDYNLCDYLENLLTEKNLKKNEVIKKSMINPTFGYQIFSGARNAGRDKLLQLAFGMELNLKETQRLLKHGGANELYPKNKRDAIIIFCIKKENSLSETDDALFGFNEQTICEE